MDTPFFQTGETKYGKPIIDRVIKPSTPPYFNALSREWSEGVRQVFRGLTDLYW